MKEYTEVWTIHWVSLNTGTKLWCNDLPDIAPQKTHTSTTRFKQCL